MASCNNCYGNIGYHRLSRGFSELIMDIVMSGMSVDERVSLITGME